MKYNVQIFDNITHRVFTINPDKIIFSQFKKILFSKRISPDIADKTAELFKMIMDNVQANKDTVFMYEPFNMEIRIEEASF